MIGPVVTIEYKGVKITIQQYSFVNISEVAGNLKRNIDNISDTGEHLNG